MKQILKSLFNFDKYSLKTRLLVIAGFLVLVGCFSWLYLGSSLNKILSATAIGQSIKEVFVGEEKKEVKKFYRRFDGLEAENSKDADLWPVCIMIENLLSVRPQNGLSDASIVYETLAEGGATRLMALYTGGSQSPTIGPVRSARPYYVDWAYEYACLYGHAGGSPQALGNIKDYDTNDLEALSYDQKYFWRDKSKYAPHNLYTKGENLTYALRDKELLDKQSTTRMWKFKEDTELSERGEDKKIYKLKFSSYTYEVEWKYLQEENLYLRHNADEPQRDANNGEELKAKNVVIQEVPPLNYFPSKGRIIMDTHGEGRAFVLRDGLLIEGTWKKPERTERTLFYDLEGLEIEFNRGQTWIEVMPSDRVREW